MREFAAAASWLETCIEQRDTRAPDSSEHLGPGLYQQSLLAAVRAKNEPARLITPEGREAVGLMQPMNFAIRFADAADEKLRAAIAAPLVAFNEAKTGRNDYRPLIISIEDPEGRVIGGLWGRTVYDWLFVELLVVPDALRGRGLGSELMKRAEAEALARGCHSAWLDTFEFQARGFYERLGYSCFAELRDYPVGSARYFMKKTLK